MKKKILAMIMIMTMGIATLLTGCGSNGGDGQSSGSQSGSNGNDPSKVLVLKVGDQDVYMDAVNYYAIALVEALSTLNVAVSVSVVSSPRASSTVQRRAFMASVLSAASSRLLR